MEVPEEIILLMLFWLPVKSLIRFTSVSKRFLSLILTDPKFATSQFQAARDRKSLTRRVLYTGSREFESVDLETSSFGDCSSSVRKLKCPSEPVAVDHVSLLGSCNGVVFLVVDYEIFYMWNPSTGFSKKLPDHGVVEDIRHYFSGVGYIPATDDYRLFVAYNHCDDRKDDVAVYSSRANAWQTFEYNEVDVESHRGFFFSKRLHWITCPPQIVAFDLAQQEDHKFRKMLKPKEFNDHSSWQESIKLSSRECLLLVHFRHEDAQCIHVIVWGMREYDVPDSWTKLFSLKFLDPPKEEWGLPYSGIFVMETSTVFTIGVGRNPDQYFLLVKILHKGDKSSFYKVGKVWDNILYQESLLWIDD